MLSLAAPWWLLILPLPWLAWRLSQSHSNKQTTAPALLHPQAALLAELEEQQRRRLPWFWLLGAMLLIAALARPQWLHTDEHQGRNFMLAIDLSSSMKALDFLIDGQPVTRIEAVKHVAHNFIEQRQGDRIGLIVFADDAFTLLPVSTDYRLAEDLLKDMSHGIVGSKTALGQAIALATRRMQELDPSSRNLILLTDGSNTSGAIQPQQALAMAKAEGVRIYTIGVGRADGRVMFQRGPVKGATLEEVPLDETLLKQLAEQTGGRYYHAIATDQLTEIMHDIEQLETVTIDNATSPPRELYLWPLLLGLLLLAASQWRSQREALP